jgi:hypothetical protein
VEAAQIVVASAAESHDADRLVKLIADVPRDSAKGPEVLLRAGGAPVSGLPPPAAGAPLRYLEGGAAAEARGRAHKAATNCGARKTGRNSATHGSLIPSLSGGSCFRNVSSKKT